MLWDLFLTFFLIGCFSFGGGYAMIPVIEREVVTNHGWMTIQEFTDVIAVAGMSPGPIATNSAIFVGYQVNGVAGSFISAIGMILPSFIIIMIVSLFFYRIQEHTLVKSAFYGLRPMITGLILYAAIKFGLNNEIFKWDFSFHQLSLFTIFICSLLAMLKFKMHPVFVILISGMVGIVLYT